MLQGAVADLSTRELAAHVGWVPQWSSSTIIGRTVLDEVLVASHALGRSRPSGSSRPTRS